MPMIADYLKYANLQMAAEAFLNDPDTGDKNYSGTALRDALNTKGVSFTFFLEPPHAIGVSIN